MWNSCGFHVDLELIYENARCCRTVKSRRIRWLNNLAGLVLYGLLMTHDFSMQDTPKKPSSSNFPRKKGSKKKVHRFWTCHFFQKIPVQKTQKTPSPFPPFHQAVSPQGAQAQRTSCPRPRRKSDAPGSTSNDFANANGRGFGALRG